MAEQEQIEGTVEDIIYENEDNGYTVFELSGGGVVTVVCGVVGELHAGESVVCRGRYENHATYGRQFHAQECETDMPKDLEAVYAFLASKSLPYIGAKTADKIIDLFGAEALEVIANDPARLTQALNVELQNLLNPEQKGKPQLQSASRVFRVGDKVMQVRNNYEIVWNRIGGEQGVGAYNGDIGIVESINPRDRSMVVRMDDRRLIYPAENLGELEIAYAITVHKSQGSEFPAVILPVAQVPPRLCYRNLFYTGVTRARKLCIVAGRRDVVNRMMGNVRQNLRYSGLCYLLQAELPPEQMKTEE